MRNKQTGNHVDVYAVKTAALLSGVLCEFTSGWTVRLSQWAARPGLLPLLLLYVYVQQ